MSLAIKVNDLMMAYAGGIEVLRGFTHSFEAGSFTAIVGPIRVWKEFSFTNSCRSSISIKREN